MFGSPVCGPAKVHFFELLCGISPDPCYPPRLFGGQGPIALTLHGPLGSVAEDLPTPEGGITPEKGVLLPGALQGRA